MPCLVLLNSRRQSWRSGGAKPASMVTLNSAPQGERLLIYGMVSTCTCSALCCRQLARADAGVAPALHTKTIGQCLSDYKLAPSSLLRNVL
jgi:hypothetical protein